MSEPIFSPTIEGGPIIEDGFVSEVELACRWNLHRRTLQRWRCDGLGPAFIQLGRRIVYRPCDIATFEARMRHDPLGLS